MPVKNTCTTAFPSPNPTTCATIDITGYSQGTTVEYIVGNAIADNKPTISSADGAPSNTAGERSVAYSVSPALPGGLSISTVASICVCNGVAQPVITATMWSTATALCVPASGGLIKYIGSNCGNNKILWTSAQALDLRPDLSSAACTWDWTTHEAQSTYGGSCGVAPTVDGGHTLPTKDDGSGGYCADSDGSGFAWCYADDGLCADQTWSSSSSMFWVKAVCNQGVISGTPTVGAAEAAYVVTATNSAGDVGKKTITITVKSPLGKKPVITSYTVAAATGCVSAPKSGWVRPNGEPHSAMCRDGSAGCVAISAAGAESCRDQCKAGGYKYVEREAICDTASYHITSGIHPLYTVIAVYAPMYTRYTCIYTICTPNTPL